LHPSLRRVIFGFVAEPLQILVLSDGKPGHVNQSLGLAEAMARLRPAEIATLPLDPEKSTFGKIRQAMQHTATRPHIIIAAGHSTNLPLLLAARKYDAHGICMMKPGLPMSWFGTCIVPEHDFTKPPAAGNIITSKGALNRVIPAQGGRSGKLLLIGGPSKNHGYDETGLIQQIARIATEGGWELADSRRTPATFLPAFEKDIPGIMIHRHQETEPGWLARRLSSAEEVWVTEDSVSMVYEALTGGAKVRILEIPRLRPDNRVIRGLEMLRSQGYFSDNPPPLSEADRCAAILINRM
jgi:mitochondrial fission protein ELM1